MSGAILPDDESFNEPYERQPGEPSKAHSVFCVYRDLGVRRSLKEACKRFYGSDYNHHKLRNCQEWSRKWDWVRRVGVWDAFLDKEARLSNVESVREMNRRYANTAKALAGKAILGLTKIKPDELDAFDVARLIELANKIERMCYGEATEHTKTNVKVEGKVEGFVTLEVVERIVPITGHKPEATAEPTAESLPPAPLSLPGHTDPVSHTDGEGAAGEFDLPAEPPLGV